MEHPIEEMPDFMKYPIDKEGFVQSFTIDDEENIKKFFELYGIVVVRDIIDEERIQKTVDEIWNCPYLLNNGKVKKEDPNTWENNSWPTYMGLGQAGFLSHFADANLPMCWENRQDPKLFHAFEIVWKRSDLWVNFDRYGMMRPTKNIKYPDGTVKDKPEWKTRSNWLHWDQNPWKEPEFVRVQGVLALSNTNSSTGGFHAVPGFTHKFKEWMEAHQSEKRNGGIINVPEEDEMRNHIQQMHLRKGSLLIWDSRIPHGNFPNDSDQFRIVQYITFFPANETNEKEVKERIESFDINIPQLQHANKARLTELGEKILGKRSWK